MSFTISNITLDDVTVYFQGPAGQAEFTTPGTYSWTAPAGITSVCAVCIGGGAGGTSNADNWAYVYLAGGGGGGLGWKNNIPVVPGQTYTVVVGAGGETPSGGGAPGGDSYFIDRTTVAGFGGSPFTSSNRTNYGGGYVGDGGGNGGSNTVTLAPGAPYGAGGAGGYTGNGGNGGYSWRPTSLVGNVQGSGGAAAGSYSVSLGTIYTDASGGGGGVGIYGWTDTGITAQQGGSGGTNGSDPTYISGYGETVGGNGGLYGGGGGFGSYGNGGSGGTGGHGAVRLIWGVNRAFPNINTGNV
jgi:hypothetical protein